MSLQTNKDSNPKDALATNRIDMGLVSDLAVAEEALAMTEGMFKYGRFNYRGAGVRVSVYIAAARRHLAKYHNGEDRDLVTGVHHLGNARACLGVIFDSLAMGNLTDDRPPRCPALVQAIDDLEKRVSNLRALYEHKKPYHWSIQDTPVGVTEEDYGSECCDSPHCIHSDRVRTEGYVRDMSALAYPEEKIGGTTNE